MSVNQQDSKHEIGAFTELELGMLPEVTELARHLSMTTNLSSARVHRIIADVITAMSETLDDFVIRRHAELQQAGLKNSEIYQKISLEAGMRVFSVQSLTERQIRRMIYG